MPLERNCDSSVVCQLGRVLIQGGTNVCDLGENVTALCCPDTTALLWRYA